MVDPALQLYDELRKPGHYNENLGLKPFHLSVAERRWFDNENLRFKLVHAECRSCDKKLQCLYIVRIAAATRHILSKWGGEGEECPNYRDVPPSAGTTANVMVPLLLYCGSTVRCARKGRSTVSEAGYGVVSCYVGIWPSHQIADKGYGFSGSRRATWHVHLSPLLSPYHSWCCFATSGAKLKCWVLLAHFCHCVKNGVDSGKSFNLSKGTREMKYGAQGLFFNSSLNYIIWHNILGHINL